MLSFLLFLFYYRHYCHSEALLGVLVMKCKLFSGNVFFFNHLNFQVSLEMVIPIKLGVLVTVPGD